ncbi:heterotrimeric G-protein alpha subunit, GPA3-like protein [Cyathus striatus]|nr:heterotrimeric G-protein alpha subunit, GPA3-like protein [Cyathus striatus]
MKAKARSDALQRQIDEDNKKLKRECKILLLGTSDSEKSTIVKQMKIHHHGGFSHEELMQYRPIVYQNLIESAQQVIAGVKELGFAYESRKNQLLAEKIYAYNLGPDNRGLTLNYKIAKAIEVLWKDPVIAKVMDDHSEEFHLADSANYFCTEAMRISEPDYLPNQTDVLMARETYGVTETRFMIGQLSVYICDIGHRRLDCTEKWTHCFENVTSILFCASLSGYDQMLAGEKKQNQLNESLTLFEAIVNSRWFLRTSVILLFTEIDIFTLKIMKSPLEQHFPEYLGGRDVNKATKYILLKFMALNRARLSIYPHLSEATVDNNVTRLIFAALKESILQNALRDSGIL